LNNINIYLLLSNAAIIYNQLYTVSQKNVLTLKRYSSKLQGEILMKFGRNIQNTLE